MRTLQTQNKWNELFHSVQDKYFELSTNSVAVGHLDHHWRSRLSRCPGDQVVTELLCLLKVHLLFFTSELFWGWEIFLSNFSDFSVKYKETLEVEVKKGCCSFEFEIEFEIDISLLYPYRTDVCIVFLVFHVNSLFFLLMNSGGI